MLRCWRGRKCRSSGDDLCASSATASATRQNVACKFPKGDRHRAYRRSNQSIDPACVPCRSARFRRDPVAGVCGGCRWLPGRGCWSVSLPLATSCGSSSPRSTILSARPPANWWLRHASVRDLMPACAGYSPDSGRNAPASAAAITAVMPRLAAPNQLRRLLR